MRPSKLNIANLPTPIQKVEFRGSKFLVKRDDYTGTELSGNKIRKLDYILADVKKKKAAIEWIAALILKQYDLMVIKGSYRSAVVRDVSHCCHNPTNNLRHQFSEPLPEFP